MSRGLGHIQRKIIELIDANPDDAWTISDLCRVVYDDRTVTKAQRVAVGRALNRMTLPGTWRYMQRVFSTSVYLYDIGNHASVRAACAGYGADHFKPGTNPNHPTIYDWVERNKAAYRDR